MNTNYAIKFAFIFATINCISQVGIGTVTPEASLDISSTNSGVLIPRIALVSSNLATPLVAPTHSELIYNTAATSDVVPGYYYWNYQPSPGTSSWVKLGTSTDGWGLFGNSNTSSSSNFIGTTDSHSLRFKTNNVDRFTINTISQLLAHASNNATAPIYSFFSDYDTGMFRISGMNNTLGFSAGGVERIRIGDNETVVNNSNLNYSFRIKGEHSDYIMFSEPTNDVMIFGNDHSFLIDNGTNFNTESIAPTYNTTATYVASFYNGDSRGTTTGLGSIEHIIDGEGEFFFSHSLSPKGKLIHLGREIPWQSVNAYNYITISDINAKTNVTKMSYGLKELLKLNTISYTLKDDLSQKTQLGVIAQEIKKEIPEAAFDSSSKFNEQGKIVNESSKYIGVSYDSLIPVLIKSIQEQQQQIEELKKRIEVLEKK
jgi:hypothetical protein